MARWYEPLVSLDRLTLERSLAKYSYPDVEFDFVRYGMTTQSYEFTKRSIFHMINRI